ncbi:hypothetical protein BCR43DRAFT_493262 [Syncephalastrum racemosum]|uniref:Uncharacterized protein n=1 Tax=Syncephalastrum racemosum TaxID=13706 RepID=A0A1X2HAA2_SYNRA|nr:hypothetical protein BCR43DRAFT_493262 [Syncephalastrum racemosum]
MRLLLVETGGGAEYARLQRVEYSAIECKEISGKRLATAFLGDNAYKSLPLKVRHSSRQ